MPSLDSPPKKSKIYQLVQFAGKEISIHLIVSFFCGLLIVVVEIGLAFALQTFLAALGISKVNASTAAYSLTFSVLLFAGIAVLRSGLRFYEEYITKYSEALFRGLQRKRLADWSLHQRQLSIGQVSSLFNEHITSSSNVIRSIQQIAIEFTASLFILLYLFYLSWQLSLIVCLGFVVIAFPARYLGNRVKAKGVVASAQWGKISNRLTRALKNLLMIRLYGVADQESRAIAQHINFHLGRIRQFAWVKAFQRILPELMGLALVACIAIFSDTHFEVRNGMTLTYLYLLVRMSQNLASVAAQQNAVFFYWPQLAEVYRWWKNNYFEFSVAKPSEASKESSLDGPLAWRLSNVSFSYDGRKLIKNMNLDIPAGSCLAIIGPSGSGKSSLLALLVGELQPTEGKIEATLNETYQPLTEFKSKIHQSVGFVGPESYLIEGNIEENLNFGLKNKATTEEIEKALSKANCSFVWELPDKLQHKISDQGEGLSAGQKQRLNLARALLRKPKILILDEPTSNLDDQSQEIILKSLQSLAGEISIILCTHRREPLKIANQILDLQAEPTSS